MRRRRGLGFAILALFSPLPASGQAQAPRYEAAALRCVALAEHRVSRLTTDVTGHLQAVTVERWGRWQWRGRPDTGGVAVTAWYDSLIVTREAAGARSEAQTGGLVGGRWRGILSPDGRLSLSQRPFIPEPLAAFADFSDAPAGLWPRLPTSTLAPGGEWSDSATGLVITRLPDTVASGLLALRYRETDELEETTAGPVPVGDTAPVAVHQRTTGRGEFLWRPGDGLIRRTRRLTTEAEIPSTSRRRGGRWRVTDELELQRVPASCDSRSRSEAAPSGE